MVQKDVLHADQQIIKPMIRASAEKYAQEKKLTKRDCAKEARLTAAVTANHAAPGMPGAVSFVERLRR